jgi:uncharacterized membrane protein YbhN (UPF0104 family)
VADRLLDVAALGVLIGVGAAASRGVLPDWAARVTTILLVVAALTLALFAPLALRRPLASWPRRLRRPVGRALVTLRRLGRHPAAAARAFALSLAIQSAFVLLNVWIGRSVGIAVPAAVWFVAWPLAKVAGLVPVSLGGIAVRDVAFGALLVPLGVPMATGVVAHLVWQSVMVAGALTAGLAWWLLSRAAGKRADVRTLRDLAPHRGHG